MGTGQALVRLGQMLLDLLFPPRCVACGRYGQLVCGACAAAMPKALLPRCPVCWEAQPSAEVCGRCLRQRPSFAAVRSLFTYEGPVRAVVHAYKYRYVSALAKPMAAFMADGLRQHFSPAVILVPVPLFPQRQRSRGYNQAALLARELAQLCGLPLAEGALVRRRNTPPQAQLMGPTAGEARHNNVQGAFAAKLGVLPPDAAVLLVDDVMASGATLEACASALKEAGASAIFGLVFARED